MACLSVMLLCSCGRRRDAGVIPSDVVPAAVTNSVVEPVPPKAAAVPAPTVVETNPEVIPSPVPTTSGTALTPQRLTAMSDAELRTRRDAVVAELQSSLQHLAVLTKSAPGQLIAEGMAPATDRIVEVHLRSAIREHIRDRVLLDRAIAARVATVGRPQGCLLDKY